MEWKHEAEHRTGTRNSTSRVPEMIGSFLGILKNVQSLKNNRKF